MVRKGGDPVKDTVAGWAGVPLEWGIMTIIRDPIAAGLFYPEKRAALRGMLARLFGTEAGTTARPMARSTGIVCPHAGYVYSGAVAAHAYREIAMLGRPAWAILLGANHTGMGEPLSTMREGVWRTPLGDAPIAADLADRLIAAGFSVSERAFLREHSLEVQLPFLQLLYGEDFPFVPVSVQLAPLATLRKAGEAVAELAAESGGLVVASSDFTHYQPHDIAEGTDRRAIEKILALDIEGFYRLVAEEGLSICGGGAITILMQVASILDWTDIELLEYATSGDITGERDAVVGYAAIAFHGGACDT